MDFRSYGSIKAAYDEQTVQAAILRGLAKGPWIATEKIHGANFALWVDAEGIRCARRTDFLASGDRFHGWEAIREGLAEGVRAIFERLSAERGAARVVIYGELFGGEYPHPEVERLPDSAPVQRGVYYSPEVRFYAFDLVVEAEGGAYYLDIFEANALFEAQGFLYAEPLHTGDLRSLLAEPNDFVTLLPERFGLPPIESNLSEGLVIRMGGDHPVDRSRFIFKSKNPRFAELVEKVVRPHRPKAPSGVDQLSPEAKAAHAELLRYLSPARMDAVRSKELEDAPLPKLMGLCVRDALKDFSADQPGVLKALDKAERKVLNRALTLAVAELLG